MNLKEEFIDIYNSNIRREGSQELLKWIETTDFFTAPASTKFHCACREGLAMHSLNVYKVLIEKTIGPYLKALKDGEFETAYSYHAPEYNQYVSYDEFLNKVKDKNYDSYTVLNVVKIRQNMY